MENVLDTFFSAANKRKIELIRRTHTHKPYIIRVSFGRLNLGGGFGGTQWTMISECEYHTQVAARADFEARRPTMRVQDSSEEVPMQRGKRLVQEMLQEKLK